VIQAANQSSQAAQSGSPSPEITPEAAVGPVTESVTEPAMIMVYIIGTVKNPDVYALTDGSRVIDAVNAAGGFTDDADRESVNLSSRVYDTQEIKIYRVGENRASETAAPDITASPAQTPGQTAAAAQPSAAVVSQKVNINTATKAELETLPGIGDVIAGNIIKYREDNGGFKSIDEIKNVDRIGDKTFEKLKDLITI